MPTTVDRLSVVGWLLQSSKAHSFRWYHRSACLDIHTLHATKCIQPKMTVSEAAIACSTDSVPELDRATAIVHGVISTPLLAQCCQHRMGNPAADNQPHAVFAQRRWQQASTASGATGQYSFQEAALKGSHHRSDNPALPPCKTIACRLPGHGQAVDCITPPAPPSHLAGGGRAAPAGTAALASSCPAPQVHTSRPGPAQGTAGWSR